MKCLTQLCLIGLLAAELVPSFPVFADDVFRDSFTGSDGPLIGRSAALGGTWAQTGTNASNPIQILGGTAELVPSGQDAYTAFSTPVANVAAFGLKTSLDLNVSAAQAAGDYFLHLSDPVGSTTNFYQRLFARSSADGYQLGLLDTSGRGSATTWGTQELSFGTNYHVDLTWNFTSAAVNDTFLVALDNAPYLSHSWTGATTKPAQISAVNFRQGTAANAPTLRLDNLVVTSVQPPPAPFNIFKWQYIDPSNPSLGKQESTALTADGYDLHAQPGLIASFKNLSMAYLHGADLQSSHFYSTNLADSDLSQANLTNADFSFATLTGGNLNQANLTNAIFYGATLTGAVLTGADVRGASFSRYNTSEYLIGGTGINTEQLSSTASYQAHDLTGINFGGSNLSGVNLTGQNLTNVNFFVANLTGANLNQANLTNTSFHGATLTGADLTGAELRGVRFDRWINPYNAESVGTGVTAAQLSSTASYLAHDLTGISLVNNDLTDGNFADQNLTNANVYGANLTNANLSQANLTNANLGYAILTNADLSHANLTGANFTFATLTGANLTGADVRRARFEQSASVNGLITLAQLYTTASYRAHDLTGIYLDLGDTDLSGANFAGQNLTNASVAGDLTNANFRQANLTGASVYWLTGADLTGAEVRGAALGGITAAQLYSTASYQARDLTGIRLTGNSMDGWSFAGQNLTNVNFSHALTDNVNFSQANLTNTNFTYARLVGANFDRTDLTNLSFTAANLTDASFRQANFSNTSFFLATLYYAHFNHTNLANADFGGADLYGVDLTGAEIRGANFGRVAVSHVSGPGFGTSQCSGKAAWNSCWGGTTSFIAGSGISLEQLASTASYQAQDLAGVNFVNNDLTGANFAGHNLTNAGFFGATLTGADLSGADARGAGGLDGFAAPNLIRPNGHVDGLELTAGQVLAVRDYDGDPANGVAPLPITVDQHFAMGAGGTLQMLFEADAWDSTISFAAGISVTLGGTLELAFADGTDLHSQIGRTFDLFDWTGASPTGAFHVESPYSWNLSKLYTTGEATLTAVPEPSSLAFAVAGVIGLVMSRRRRVRFAKRTQGKNQ